MMCCCFMFLAQFVVVRFLAVLLHLVFIAVRQVNSSVKSLLCATLGVHCVSNFSFLCIHFFQYKQNVSFVSYLLVNSLLCATLGVHFVSNFSFLCIHFFHYKQNVSFVSYLLQQFSFLPLLHSAACALSYSSGYLE